MTSSGLVLAPYSDGDKDTDDDELNAGIKTPHPTHERKRKNLKLDTSLRGGTVKHQLSSTLDALPEELHCQSPTRSHVRGINHYESYDAGQELLL
jgi:hypothetical protein